VTLQEASEFLEKKGVAGARAFLRSAREAAKVSQLELSRLSGVPQPNLNRIESGEQEGFTARTFVRLYNAIEKRLIANHRHARRAEKLMHLSQKHGPLPQRELLALLGKEEKAALAEKFAALKSLGPLAHYAALAAIGEGKTNFAQYAAVIGEARQQEIDRKRQLAALENATSLDDPIVQEVIQLFRDEIESLQKTNDLLSRELTRANSDD
jgi:transcriptional regulator with XRE-family HTH domain